MIFYLLLDKRKSVPGTNVTYIVNYMEKDSKTGMIRVDGHGWVEAEILFESKTKLDCIAYANKYALEGGDK